jgi:tetratricopeptide (TPR) repeat protein
MALAILIFLGLAVSNTITAQDISGDVKKALKLVEIEQSAKAIESINTLIKTYPADATLWYYLGYVHIKRGELDKALTSFDKGIQINEKEALNHAGKGYVRALQNNAAEAKTFFDKALEYSKSKNPAVLNAVAEAYISTKNATAAMPLLTKSKGINSKDPETHILLGDAYLQQGNGSQGGQAVTSYETAASLDPKNARPHYKVGIVYSRSKNVTSSTEAFNQAVTIDPNYAPAYKELGEIYYIAKDGAKAVQAQEKYIALTENPEPAKLQLAFYVFMTKDYAKANTLFEPLVKKPETPPVASRFYAVSLYEGNTQKSTPTYEQSRAAFEQYFEKSKKEELQATDYVYYGRVLLALKQDSLAIQSFDNSLVLDSTNLEIRQLHAETLYSLKRYAESAESYNRLIALRGAASSLDLYSLGRAYYYGNQLAEADTTFNKLIKKEPTRTIGYLWVARLRAMADPESTQGLAKPFFEKIIELAAPEPEKSTNKKDLIEAYSYLGYYYYLKNQNATSMSYWEKVLVLNPADQRAKEAIEILKKRNAAAAPKK